MTRREPPAQTTSIDSPGSAGTRSTPDEGGRRRIEEALAAHELWLNSQGAMGTQLVLHDIELRNVQFAQRRLARCELRNVTIVGGTLASSQIGGSVLENVRIEGVDLREADIAPEASMGLALIRCDATDATIGSLTAATFSDCDFTRANFAKAVIRGLQAGNAVFSHARLLKAYIDDADLHGCDFSAADLTKAHIYRSDLRNCLWADATLHKTHLGQVRMAGGRGLPREYETLRIDRVDLSTTGDGSQMLAPEHLEELIEAFRTAG